MAKCKKRKKVIELVEGEGKRKSGVVMGIDVHKNVLAYCVGSEKSILIEGEFQNTKEHIAKIIKICKDYQTKSVAMESTSQFHFKLMYALLHANIPILVANPCQTKNTQGKKTDKLDARRIYIAHRDGRLKPSVISPEETMQLRKAMRQLFKLINEQTKIRQRLAQLFHQKEFKIHTKFPKFLRHKWGIKVMQHFLDEDIRLVVNNSYPNKNKSETVEFIIWELKNFKKKLGEIEKITLRTDIVQLSLLKNLIDQIRLIYVNLAKKNKDFRELMKLLLTIPGIGPDTAAIVLAEIVDISYFKKPEKLAKWAGLAPRVYQSGHRKKITGKIHKGGNKYLRRALTLACTSLYAKGDKSNSLWNFMKSKYRNSKQDSYWRAICAASRKLLVIIWFMLKRNQEWKWEITDKSVLKKMQTKIEQKIKRFKGKIEKYQKASEMLNQEIDQVLENSLYRGENPKKLLKVLLSSV